MIIISAAKYISILQSGIYQHTSQPHFNRVATPPPYHHHHHHHQFMRQSTTISLDCLLETYPIPGLRICTPFIGLKSHKPVPFFQSLRYPPSPRRIDTYQHFSRFIYHPPSSEMVYVIPPIQPIHPTQYIGS